MTTIEKIRAEIERRITDNTFGAKLELIDILAWLSTLESEKPMNQDGLEEELEKEINKAMKSDLYPEEISNYDFRCIARHFAQWQKEQTEKRWLEDRDGCFWDGVEEGKKAMKEQMLKEYVRKDSLWKPTPEQLEAMECAIIDYEEDGCNTIARYLKEIYNQIKKL